MALAKTYSRIISNWSVNGVTSITPSAGECIMLGPGCLSDGSNAKLTDSGGHVGLNWPETSAKIFIPISGTTYIKNFSGGVSSLALTAPVTTLADEGITAATIATPNTTAAVSVLPWVAGKCWYILAWSNDDALNGIFSLYDKGAPAFPNPGTPFIDLAMMTWGSGLYGWRPFFLWSDLNLQVGFRSGNATSRYGIMVAVQYDEATLSEWADRISVRQSLGPSETYTLHPANGEIWWIDYVWWGYVNSQEWWWNGVQMTSAPPSRFCIGPTDTIQLKNTNASASFPLFISGTKEKIA